jgi:hypothetical protein
MMTEHKNMSGKRSIAGTPTSKATVTDIVRELKVID